MTDVRSAQGTDRMDLQQEYVDLMPMVRRVVAARVKDPNTVEDLVQETVARVMAARARVGPEKLAAYAAVTARNLVASMAEKNDRARERSHLLVDPDGSEPLVEGLLRDEERSVVTVALANLSAADRDALMAHDVQGQDLSSMAESLASTPGAVAARLSRARASLRIEYLLATERVEPSSDRCRPVLRALSSGDRRRQRELDVDGHVLGCPCCTRVRELLFEHRGAPVTEEVRVTVVKDSDVVVARQRGREVAAQIGFSAADLTLIATAVSEIARNIVKFAERGELVFSTISRDGRRGVGIVARDVGPGIPDPQLALQDGYSTYHGLGLGLPGARRLMDRLDVSSVAGEGTTVTMEKWLAPRHTGEVHRPEQRKA